MEYEADEIGMRLLTGACFDPNAGPRMMKTLEAFTDEYRRMMEEKDGSRGMDGSVSMMRTDDETQRKEVERYLSTHPLNEERIAAMRERTPRLFDSVSSSDCGEYAAGSSKLDGIDHPPPAAQLAPREQSRGVHSDVQVAGAVRP
jgi:predicted Zn-dependent protease